MQLILGILDVEIISNQLTEKENQYKIKVIWDIMPFGLVGR
jgi:hypothetical protein